MSARRQFLKQSIVTAAGLALAGPAFGAPTILTSRRVHRRTERGRLVFRPSYVQRGRGPHLLDWAYASDANWDAFYSDIEATGEGVSISDTHGEERFGVNVRWNVEGFGYLFITADNGGEHYSLPPAGQTRELDLNLELARSRVARNRRRLETHRVAGWRPTREPLGLHDVSEGYFEDAERVGAGERRARYAQQALLYALKAGEAIELDAARQAIERRETRGRFYFGCDARGFFQMNPDLWMELFTELFDYATITHYLADRTHGLPDFEPVMDDRRFDTREALLERLRGRGVTVQGRPIFWPYHSVTPDWMRALSYDDLLRYVERHTREVVGHYGDRMYGWEIVNEFHDWANEVEVTPEQAVEITRLACDVARDAAPNVHRLINNCCPFAEYVQLRQWGEREAHHPQRTPWKFMRDLTDAGVDFTITGQQMYFPYRCLQDTIVYIERLEEFGRPVQLTEVGASSGPSRRSVLDGSLGFPDEPHIWRRPWDEKLQADWMEGLYTLAYSKPWIEATNWYDFMDGQAWIRNGGVIASQGGERKQIFERMLELQQRWGERG